MKHLAPLASLSLLLLLWVGCKSSYTPDTYPKAQLVFGSGGGFTGEVSTYYLFQNGQLFHQPTRDAELQEVQEVNKTAAKQLFERAESFGLNERRLNAPGNMYNFLEWRTPDGSNRMVWDQADNKIDMELQVLHRALMRLSTPLR